MDQENSEELTEANRQLESETKVKPVPFVLPYICLLWACIWHQCYHT